MTASISDLEVKKSLYNPYKLWTLSSGQRLKVILVKAEDKDCLGICPQLGVEVSDPDYLQASFALQKAIFDKLGIPEGQSLSSTCCSPFSVDFHREEDIVPEASIGDGEIASSPVHTEQRVKEGDSESQFSLF